MASERRELARRVQVDECTALITHVDLRSIERVDEPVIVGEQTTDRDRITLIDRMRIPYNFDQEDTNPALSLFPNPDDLQVQLTADLMKGVRK